MLWISHDHTDRFDTRPGISPAPFAFNGAMDAHATDEPPPSITSAYGPDFDAVARFIRKIGSGSRS